MVGFGHPYLLVLLPLVLGWIYWTYARRRPPVVPAAGVWLLQRASARGRARRRLDLRLALLLLAGAAMLLALAAPTWRTGKPERLVVVLDASASMTATDADGRSRFDRARQRAAVWLAGASNAVLVRAGRQPQGFGPARGTGLLASLETLRAGDAGADLGRAVALGRRLLPGAAVLVIGDAPPPAELRAAFLDVAANEPNAGLTALGARFAAVYNAGPGSWNGRLSSSGRSWELNLPPGRFAAIDLEATETRRSAVLHPEDAMALDQKAYLHERPPRVRLQIDAPSVARALAALGARRAGAADAEAAVRPGPPPENPEQRPTLYLASTDAALPDVVYDVDPTHPFTRGVELVGYRLPAPPPPPGGGWRILAARADGLGVVYARGGELYLPRPEALRDLPAFVVLLYNWLEPVGASYRPLGWNGVLEPGVRDGFAVNLLDYAETRLPRPSGDRLEPVDRRRPVAAWLALLAALLLVLQEPRRRSEAVG